MMTLDNRFVIAVSRSSNHSFSKMNRESITLLTGFGVEDDTHLARPSSIAQGWLLTRINPILDRFT